MYVAPAGMNTLLRARAAGRAAEPAGRAVPRPRRRRDLRQRRRQSAGPQRSGCCSPAWAATAPTGLRRMHEPVPTPSARTSRPAWSGACRPPPRRWARSSSSSPLSRHRRRHRRTRSAAEHETHRERDPSDADRRRLRDVRDYLRDGAGSGLRRQPTGRAAAVVAERIRTPPAPVIGGPTCALSTARPARRAPAAARRVTVQETYFFRNPPQMEALRRRVLPELLRRSAGRDRPLTIWSAGCSTGEEPYTLAMLLLELSPMARLPLRDPHRRHRRVRRGAAGGRRGVLHRAHGRDDAGHAARPLVRAAGRAARWRCSDEVRRLVDLRLHNLVTDPPPFAKGEVDLIVCRNVTIYFARDTTRNLVGRFHDVLAEGGYLLLGHSETLWQVSDAFTLVPVGDAFVYRRSHEAASDGSPPVAPSVVRRPAGAAPAAVPAPDRRCWTRRAVSSPRATTEAAARAAADAVAADPLLSSGVRRARSGPLHPRAGRATRWTRCARPSTSTRPPGTRTSCSPAPWLVSGSTAPPPSPTARQRGGRPDARAGAAMTCWTGGTSPSWSTCASDLPTSQRTWAGAGVSAGPGGVS